MAKSYKDFKKSMAEWATPTAHTAHTTTRLSVRTDKSKKAKRPSVIQQDKIPFTKLEKEKKGIHFSLLSKNK
jgi:hypothetical protein